MNRLNGSRKIPMSSTDVEDLRRFGYLPGCDKRDPNLVFSFHKSMTQNACLPPSPLGRSFSQSTTTAARDGRTIKPSDWGEVLSLQKALEPTRQSFSALNGRPAPAPQLWDNYVSQWKALDKHSKRFWNAAKRQGQRPHLVALKRWSGRIQDWECNQAWITQEIECPYRCAQLDSTLANQQVLRAHQFHESAAKELRQAFDTDHYELKEDTSVRGLPQEIEVIEPIKDILADSVSKDPQAFASWLATKGAEHYSQYAQMQHSLSWKDFSSWLAPSRYEYESNPGKALKPGRIYRASAFDDQAPIASIEEAYREVIKIVNAIRTRDVFMGTNGKREIQEANAIQQKIRD